MMALPRRASAPRGVAALVAVAAVLATLVAPAAALAADITFGESKAVATYGEGIEFTVPVTSPAPIARVELRLEFPEALGPFIVNVPVTEATGSQTLRYALDLTGGGHLVPNTPLRYTWAAFPAIGAQPVVSRTERIRYADSTQDWRSLKGDLITVHWYEGGESFARKALEIGEAAVRDTSALLGVTETEPIDFFIYGGEDAFRTALGPGTRENVGGQAHADIRTLFALITPDEINDRWVGIVVPHELVHLVFDTAVSNPLRFPPRWLNEGLAVYLSQGYGALDRNNVVRGAEAKDLVPLVALGGQFPTDPGKTSLAYAESVSAIDYLVRTHGRDAMIQLVLGYKDGLTDDEAFERAIGEDLGTFEAGWLAELGADPPQQFGPQPAPAGPLPSGWTDPATTSGPGGATSRPGETPAPGQPLPSPAGSVAGSSAPLIVGGLVLVIVIVVVGLVVARRRGGTA